MHDLLNLLHGPGMLLILGLLWAVTLWKPASQRLAYTISGTPYTPGGTAGANAMMTAWQKNFEDAVYEDAVAYPVTAPRDRLYNALKVRKLLKFSTSSLGQDVDGTALSYAAPTIAVVTISPKGVYVAVNQSMNFVAQLDADLSQNFRRSTEQAVAQGIDQDVLQLVASLTTNVKGNSVSGFDLALLTGAMAQLRQNVGSFWNPGEPAYFHYTPTQYDDIMSIPGIVQANLRGDAENPMVRGLLHEGLGLRFVVTGNVYIDGTPQAWNTIWLPPAFGVSFNQRPQVREQEFELAERLYCFSNYGTAIVWDERAVAIKTAAA